MTVIGPYINSAAIFFGAVLGASLGGRVPEVLRTNLTLIFGLSSMSMGVVMIAKVAQMPAMIFPIVIGTLIGEIIRLENGINKLAMSTKIIIEKILPKPNKNNQSQDEFLAKFVALVIMFSFSGSGVFGSMNEGATGDMSILIIKSFLDFFTAVIFSTSLGFSVATIFVPQLILQLLLAYSAVLIKPYITPQMLADFSAVGGILMVATGFRICGIKMFRLGNMLPALFLAMPISALWTAFFLKL
ncbi:DUF554 domain-containing protein [Histophilus somni]|uniref:DUF554 domain-containing protein n=1 Tax=Histophilus somni TaxID=731 RepID=A0AAX2S0T2_HISSO|nr:DUF554 domain-containing protein [Histophilus somni]TDF35317.1 DUF554 domain-containing protein [Histophilus somni]TEW25864.1 DUF554 domain-containing protein [Histophilus somni]TFF00544.1 DUF554 domain-containing protein [Histophilus somni]THA20683.1 DUF554 domain-containing protein [Histophilus somni]THA87254.1 DUF554 domain-containing protein [Histophilus somni]